MSPMGDKRNGDLHLEAVRFVGRAVVGCISAVALMAAMILLAWLVLAAMNEIGNGFDGSAMPINGAW